MRRKKLLTLGRWCSIRWSRAGQETGSIRVECLEQGLRLVYRQRRGIGDWQDVDEIVPWIKTATQFGGVRKWLQCLSCHRRCRIIYGGAHFRCRRCHRLKYETQYEPDFARAATRALKIRERLGCPEGIDAPFPERPKGMHWKTYNALAQREVRLQGVWAIGISQRFRLAGDE